MCLEAFQKMEFNGAAALEVCFSFSNYTSPSLGLSDRHYFESTKNIVSNLLFIKL